MTLTPLGDQGWLITVAAEVGEGAFARVQQVTQAVRDARLIGVREVVPAFTTVGVWVQENANLGDAETALKRVLAELPPEAPHIEGREREIPVCYGAELGPDLAFVATHTRLTPEEVIQLHSRTEYRVHAVGFSPGFPYLAGLPERLHVPRRPTPRTQVPAGSVAIAAGQCGVYPLETPGGWQILGRTPHLLFEPRAEPPAWLQPGDRVRFRPIDRAEFDRFAAGSQEARRALLPGTHPPFDAPPVITVLRPGIFTTVQDLGRHGWQSQGVPVSGAIDPVALRCANLLVGNTPDAAGLEWTLRGPVLQFEAERIVAIVGAAPAGVTVNRPVMMRTGDILDLTHLQGAVRGYLAVSGGIDVPPVLGSRSTCVRAHFGGYRGRSLRAGDALAVGAPTATSVRGRWSLAPSLQFVPVEPLTIRIVRGPQVDQFEPAGWATLTGTEFRVRADSDRMGLRLEGAALERNRPGELITIPVGTGAIQVPPDGRPIVLLADRQTLGGYPQIAYVVTADWPRLAQAAAGTRLRFQEIALPEAEGLRREQERSLGLLALGLREKLGRS